MKNILLLIIFVFTSCFVFGQIQTQRMLVGRCNLQQTGGSANHWRLSGNFTDGAGLHESSDINVGDKVFFTDGGIGFLLPIDTVVSATPPSFVISVNKTGITAISSVPTTNSALICRGTSNHGLIPFTSGITDPDNQVSMEHTLYLIDSLLSISGSGNYTFVTTDSFTTFKPAGPIPDSALVLRTTTGNWYQKLGAAYSRVTYENGQLASTILPVTNDTLTWNANLNNRVQLLTTATSFIANPTNIASQSVGEIFQIGIQNNNGAAVNVTWDTIFGKFDLTDMSSVTIPGNATLNYSFKVVNSGGEGIKLQSIDDLGGGSSDGTVTGATYNGNTLTLTRSVGADVTVVLLKGIYKNDSAAAAGGVLVGEGYELSSDNEFGSPAGFLRIRKN